MSGTFETFGTSYSIRKWGVFSEPSFDGSGILEGALYVLATANGGTLAAQGIDANHGAYTDWQTSSLIDHPAGYHGFFLLTKPSFNPIFRCKFALDSVADCRLWVGFSSTAGATGNNPTGDDAFNGISGFALSMRANETNWQIAHNDGTGATVFDDVDDGTIPGSVTPLPVDTNVHTVEMAFNNRATGINQFGIILDQRPVQTFDTDLPLLTDSLTFTACIENSVAASAKKIRFFWMDISTEK